VLEKETAVMVGVKDHSSEFLQYLDTTKPRLGTEILVKEIVAYDSSFVIQLAGESLSLSAQVTKNILVK
jgi:DtxR family Mn-dependent transcriptional regulator